MAAKKAHRSENKLLPIARLISGLLQERFKQEAKYSFEQSFDWLINSPDKVFHYLKWSVISEVYSSLVDNRFKLDERINEYSAEINFGLQRIDIWFESPYNLIVEFDEDQHFNQFRLITLTHYNEYSKCLFDLEHYKNLSAEKIAKPGTSGFQKLKRFDPLFPEMSIGEKQDNRHRQRAFRDFIKDISSITHCDNPIIRISYKITNGRKTNFNSQVFA